MSLPRLAIGFGIAAFTAAALVAGGIVTYRAVRRIGGKGKWYVSAEVLMVTTLLAVGVLVGFVVWAAHQ